MFDTIVYVKVGPDAIVFSIHKGVLCEGSAFFRAAFDGRFKEATEQTVLLPEADVDIFERYQAWAYSDRIVQRGETIKDLGYEMIIGLYILAELCCIPRLQNAAIDIIIDKAAFHHTVPPMTCSRLIYENTTSASLLRELFEDMTTRSRLRDHESFDTETSELYDNAFLVDLALALDEERRCRAPGGFKKHLNDLRCNYHIHPEGEPRCNVGGKTVRFDVIKKR